MTSFGKIARGIRNNNPGNLELTGEKWQGLSPVQTDGRFCQFDSMEYGCRALIKVLMTYVSKHGCHTVRSIISRWAPSHENDTEAYINAVAKAAGVEPDTWLEFNGDLYLKIARAIARHENGQDASRISAETWQRALEMC